MTHQSLHDYHHIGMQYIKILENGATQYIHILMVINNLYNQSRSSSALLVSIKFLIV